MNSFKALLLGATILIFSNILFCQVNTTSFEFEYDNTKYNGAIESPNQKARGMIVIVPGHGPTDFVVGAEYSELRSFFKRNGFAVCFWDKTGCGKSEGTYNHNQSILSSAEEAIAALSRI